MLESPDIDKLAGIRNSNEDFKVSEVVDKRFLDNLSSNQDGIYRYPIYTLEKNNIDSNHALIEIEMKLGIRLKIMGIKDAKAHSMQYVSSEQTKKLLRVANQDFLTFHRLCQRSRKLLIFMDCRDLEGRDW